MAVLEIIGKSITIGKILGSPNLNRFQGFGQTAPLCHYAYSNEYARARPLPIMTHHRCVRTELFKLRCEKKINGGTKLLYDNPFHNWALFAEVDCHLLLERRI